MSTAIITSDTSINHNAGMSEHPERPERITAIVETLKKNKKLIWKKPVKYDNNILVDAHSPEYIKNVKKSFPNEGLVFLDGDTVVSPGSKDATFDAVGSIISAIDGIENKEFNAAFSLTRPPGL